MWDYQPNPASVTNTSVSKQPIAEKLKKKKKKLTANLIHNKWQKAVGRKTFIPWKWRFTFNYTFNKLPSLQGHIIHFTS